MKRRLLLVLTLVWAAAGCAVHYQKVDSGSVDLYLRMPGAHSVLLMITDDTLHAVETVRTIGGAWKTTLKGNREFNYFYLVDGRVVVPDCALREKDDFGGDNCVYSP